MLCVALLSGDLYLEYSHILIILKSSAKLLLISNSKSVFNISTLDLRKSHINEKNTQH